MLNYRLSSGLPAGSRAAWSRLLFLPHCASRLTPFSYSVLAESAGRAWFHYYDALGFDPMPRARVVRQHNGSAYFNLTMSAQREAEAAGIDPITLIVDGSPLPIAKVEKGGFLAGLKASRGEKKQERGYEAAAREVAALREEALAWYDKVSGHRWTQAEILMAMEEIEPISVKPFAVFLGARQGILRAVNRLMRWSREAPGETLRLIDAGLGASPGVVEAEIARDLARMAAQIDARAPAQARASLAAAPTAALTAAPSDDTAKASQPWEAQIAAWGIADAFHGLLSRYGYRALGPGEIAEPRWSDDPTLALHLLAGASSSAPQVDEGALRTLRDSVDGANRKSAEAAIDQLRTLIPLQSQALDVLALILAGARKWAWGAAREASLDQRIVDLDDVYYFELEELKEMMTGEWNISDRTGIQNTAQKRRSQVALWRAGATPDLFIGETPAEALDALQPSSVLEPATLIASLQGETVPA